MSDHLSAKWLAACSMPQPPSTTQLERPRRSSERDVQQADDRDHDPVEVAVVEEPEQPAADREPGRDVEPEAVDRDGPSSTAMPADRNASPTAIVTIAAQPPPFESRSNTNDQIAAGEDEDEEREPEPPQRDRGGDDGDQLEHEQPEVEAVEEDLVVVMFGSQPNQSRIAPTKMTKAATALSASNAARDEVAADARSLCCSGEERRREAVSTRRSRRRRARRTGSRQREVAARIVSPPR